MHALNIEYEREFRSEALSVGALLEHSIAALERAHPPQDERFLALLLFASGLERLCKLTLWMKAYRNGIYLTKQDFKDQGHDIERLLQRVADECFPASYLSYKAPYEDYSFIKHDRSLAGLLMLARELAMPADRYYHLDRLGGAVAEERSPQMRWRTWDSALVADDDNLKTLAATEGGYRYNYALSIRRRQLVERLLRAVCRLYGPSVFDATSWCSEPMIRWATLPDEAVGKTDYNILVKWRYDVFRGARVESSFAYSRVSLGEFPSGLVRHESGDDHSPAA